MRLHPVKHGPRANRFCGPSALSAITGTPTDFTAALLRRLFNRKQITGTPDYQMTRALHAMGYGAKQVFGTADLTWANGWKQPTLAAWLKATPRPEGKLFLVAAGNHWQVISGRRYVCGLTGEIVSIRDKRVKRRARLRKAYEITKIVTPVIQERRAA